MCWDSAISCTQGFATFVNTSFNHSSGLAISPSKPKDTTLLSTHKHIYWGEFSVKLSHQCSCFIYHRRNCISCQEHDLVGSASSYGTIFGTILEQINTSIDKISHSVPKIVTQELRSFTKSNT